MECNKDEALRAKEIAVRKFKEKDFAGAKKFALKAQTLYPSLEGVSQVLTTLDVYIASESKVNGEMDMYGILGVNPSADDDTIKKHYRKLVLLLHPDKNKFVGADGAFQLAKEAYNFLSDKAKRSAYNIRCNIRTAQVKVPSKPSVSTSTGGFRQFPLKVPTHGGVPATAPSSGRAVDPKVPTQGGVSGSQTFRTPGRSAAQQNIPAQSGNSAAPRGVNGYHNHSNNTSSSGKSRKTSTQKASSSAQGVFRTDDTFWTVCTRCKMQYEYLRCYLKQTLKCQHCQVGFIAVEIPPPSNLSPAGVQQRHQKSSSSSGPNNFGFSNSFGGTGARWSPFFGTTYGSTSSACTSTQATGVSQQANERAKRKHEEVQAASRWQWNDNSGSLLRGDGPSKRRREDEFAWNSGGTIPSHTWSGNWETGRGFAPGKSQEGPGWGSANFFQGFSSKFNVDRELSVGEFRKIMSDKALLEIRKKLKEWKMSSESRIAVEEKAKVKEKERQNSKLAKNITIQEGESYKLSSETQKGSQSKKSSSTDSAGDTEQEAVEMVAMSVPDPDFHVFDSDRSESFFVENQVWATYDNDDGMPRYYAIIHEVISSNPFKLKISWLNSKSNSEFGSLGWIDCGFTKTCGEFRVGRHETNTLLNSFSHKVNWVKGPRGVVQIYPQKGDVWALYKNWSADWNEDTPDEVRHVYDMVEVLEDYDKDRGISVAPLVKAAGFRTVFHKQADPKEVKHISREEMFRFSHQVPSHVLTGNEKPNAPKGYVELDPAATPLDLLQVIGPASQEQAMETGP